MEKTSVPVGGPPTARCNRARSREAQRSQLHIVIRTVAGGRKTKESGYYRKGAKACNISYLPCSLPILAPDITIRLMKAETLTSTTEGAIWARIVDPETGDLTRAAAQTLLGF